MSHTKQFTLYTHKGGPNGWRVCFVLRTLNLSYESIYLKFGTGAGSVKAPEFLKLNPNGRIPVLVDHKNGDFVLWESGAIMLYLIEKYDIQHALSFPPDAERERHLLTQWLFFSSSGQGPYFGQYAWFRSYHPEKVQSALDRYEGEILRVLSVLEGVLSEREWLVGGRCTVADLSFLQWNEDATGFYFKWSDDEFECRFPAVFRWHKAMSARPAVKEVMTIAQEMQKPK